MKKSLFICLLTLLASCTHEKVQVNKFSDTQLSCNEIVTETNEMHKVLADYSGPICQDTKSNIKRYNFQALNYYYYNTPLLE